MGELSQFGGVDHLRTGARPYADEFDRGELPTPSAKRVAVLA
jgi:hypothetical protein